MRKPVVARILLLASALAFGSAGIATNADAQPKPKPGAPKQPVDLDADDKPADKKPAPGKPAPGKPGGAAQPTPNANPNGQQPKAVDNSPPPSVGQPTEAAAQAKRLYEAEKWWDAAQALYRVSSGETSDDEGNKQIAQFNLAKTLYKLKFYQAAYKIFSTIADKPNHLKFNETLLWLAKLATDLPEPADVIERVGKYNEEQIGKFNNAEQRELYWQLNYLLGRYKYRNTQYNEALGLFGKVDRRSRYYVHGQFFGGISNVQMRQSKPAVQSFQRILGAIEEGAEGVEDEERMRDLAYLSMARTFYSASIKLDEATNAPTVDQTRLSAAVKYWNKVDIASEYWLDALFEESWAYFMAGDYSHALGNIHTLQSPYFPNSFYPEADILKAVIYFANCQYDDATIIVAQFRSKYEPIRDELTKLLQKFPQGEEQDQAFYKFLKSVKEGSANLDPKIKPIVENSLSDRQVLRNLEYVRVLDDEEGRFKKSPRSFKDSAVANFVQDSITEARKLAITNAGELARNRYDRTLNGTRDKNEPPGINELLRDSQKILIDITAAQRNQLDQALAGAQVTAQESQVNIVKPDEEHVIWPFNGEYWRDELGFYRQSIASKCGR